MVVTLSRQFFIICRVLAVILFYEMSKNLTLEQKEVNEPILEVKHSSSSFVSFRLTYS